MELGLCSLPPVPPGQHRALIRGWDEPENQAVENPC